MKRQSKTDDTQPTSISEANSRRRPDGQAQANPDELPLTEAQIKELDRRMTAYSQNPNEGIAWEDFRQQFRAKL